MTNTGKIDHILLSWKLYHISAKLMPEFYLCHCRSYDFRNGFSGITNSKAYYFCIRVCKQVRIPSSSNLFYVIKLQNKKWSELRKKKGRKAVIRHVTSSLVSEKEKDMHIYKETEDWITKMIHIFPSFLLYP